MRRALTLICAGAALCTSYPRAAEADPSDQAGGLSAMSDAELGDMRGGILTPLGLEIGFGAEVRTYVDGQLALQTRLTWTDQGAVTERLGDLGDVTATGAPPDGWTAVLAGDGGATQVLHDLTDGRIASVVVNTANGREIRQNTDIRLSIPQLAELQGQLFAERLNASIQNAVGLALADRSGR